MTQALLFRRCDECQQVWYLPRCRCPRCGSDAVQSPQSRGLGTVVASTVVRASKQPQDGDTGVCLVDVDEGFRAMGRCPPTTSVGTRVAVVDLRDGVPTFDQRPG